MSYLYANLLILVLVIWNLFTPIANVFSYIYVGKKYWLTHVHESQGCEEDARSGVVLLFCLSSVHFSFEHVPCILWIFYVALGPLRC